MQRRQGGGVRFPRVGGYPAGEYGAGETPSGTEDEGEDDEAKEQHLRGRKKTDGHHADDDDGSDTEYWTTTTTTTMLAERRLFPVLVPQNSEEVPQTPLHHRSKIAALLSKQNQRLLKQQQQQDGEGVGEGLEGRAGTPTEDSTTTTTDVWKLRPAPDSLPYISNLISPMTQLNYDENQNKKCSRDRRKDPNIPFPPFVKIDLCPVLGSGGMTTTTTEGENKSGVVALVNDARGTRTTTTTTAGDATPSLLDEDGGNPSQNKWHRKGEVVETDKDGVDFAHLIPYHEAVRFFKHLFQDGAVVLVVVVVFVVFAVAGLVTIVAFTLVSSQLLLCFLHF